MGRIRIVGACAVVTVAASLALTPAAGPQSTRLDAERLMPLRDTDGDLLPDALEFVTLSMPGLRDSDRDGRDDFIELIEYTDPGKKDVAKAANRRPDGFRIIVHTSEEGSPKQDILWVHLLFRVRSGQISDLGGLSLFADKGSQRFPINSLLSIGAAQVKQRLDPVQGLLLRVTMKLPLTTTFQQLAPLTFGGYTLINKKILKAGAMLFHGGGVYHTLVPIGSTLVFQGTSSTSSGSLFWSTSRSCVFQLEVQGVGLTGHICEVKKAKCEPAATQRRCTTNCAGMIGQTFFVPDGLSLILGG